LRFRNDTKEFVHDFVSGSKVQHVYCNASELRKTNSG
jgi:hypothetical protein